MSVQARHHGSLACPPELGAPSVESQPTSQPVERARDLPDSDSVPVVSPFLLRWFTWYSRRYIGRHFHSLRVSLAGLPPDSDGYPLVIYTNHASWWDPLVGLVLKAEFFPNRSLFAPIDSAMLRRYQMFTKLGFFAVDQDRRRGAVQFLRTTERILKSPNHLLAVTPQGQFADARERPVRFQPGLGHLAARLDRAVFVPMAAEYVFWEERLPEVLVRFGKPVLATRAHRASSNSDKWTARFEHGMSAVQESLAVEAQRRAPGDFQTILSGGAGQGGIYDLWRAIKATLNGEHFRKEHGTK